MKVNPRSTVLIVLFTLILSSFYCPAKANTSGVVSIDFSPGNEQKVVKNNVSTWSVESQNKSESLTDGMGLLLAKKGAKLVIQFDLPFKPQKAVLHINHQFQKPDEVELKNEPTLRYKVNGEYLDQNVDTDSPAAKLNEYWLGRWQGAHKLRKGPNTFTILVPNHYTHYYLKRLTIAYSTGRFRTSEVIQAATLWHKAILEYKKAFKGSIPGIAFYFYTLQEHEFIGGGEIYLDQIFVLPSIGDRIELPYTQPGAAATLYLNYLGPELASVELNAMSMIRTLNGSISALDGFLVRNGMNPNYADTLTQLAMEIFGRMMM